jgi:hypothetical protein
MKMQMIEMKTVKLDKKARVSIALVSILLGINSVNLIVDKVIEILYTVEIFSKNYYSTSILFYVYHEFCWFWLDIVALVNGLFFM